MIIDIEWLQGDRPQFNVSLASGEGKEPFLTIKNCRLVDGSKGMFVSWPATKNERTQKWWNHVHSSESFSAAVLEKVLETRPKPRPRDERYQAGMPAKPVQRPIDPDELVPF